MVASVLFGLSSHFVFYILHFVYVIVKQTVKYHVLRILIHLYFGEIFAFVDQPGMLEK